MKTTILHITLFLSCAVSAQTIWYKPDSLVAHPVTDSVPSTEEYTVVTVLRNLEPDSAQLLWCFTANDTLREAVLTNGIHFSEPATIAVPYDDFLLPMGYKPKDIKTYYFDEDLAQWKELERVSVDTAIICI